jgi:hypothetical protein
MQVIVPGNEAFAVPIQMKNENETVSRDFHRIGKVKIILDTAANEISLQLLFAMAASRSRCRGFILFSMAP